MTARAGRAPADVVTLTLLAVWGAVLATLAFGFHPVGDYFTESDFYGAYAAGAAGLVHGHYDPARYGVYGPGFEVALAAFRALGVPAFTSARLISVLSALLVVGASAGWARRRLGAASAAWLTALLIVNPTLLRYGYSVGTDMLAFAGFALGLAALLGRDDLRGAALTGLAAGLGALTRYNAAFLVPGAMATWLGRLPVRRSLAAIAVLTAVFLATLAPAFVAGVRAGHPPGETLLRDAGFYLDDAPATTLESRYGRGGAAADEDSRPAATKFVTRLASGVVSHAREDARLLLGWPAALLALAGLAWALATRSGRPLAALAAPAAVTFLSLAPIYHSERYSMILLPLVLAPAALLLGRAGGPLRGAAWAAGLIVLALTARESLALQRLEWRSLPRETLVAARSLRTLAAPGDRVLARKAHTAWNAGLAPVLFPEVDDLPGLAEFCARERIGWIYYSWYELRLRPQFGYLLDTAAVVPGLVPVAATSDKPSALYRVTEGFGATPAWWNDSAERARIRDRVNALMAPSLEP